MRVEEAEGEAGSHTALPYSRTGRTIDLYRERRVDGENWKNFLYIRPKRRLAFLIVISDNVLGPR